MTTTSRPTKAEDDRWTTTDITDVRPIERPEATTLAEDEVARMAAALRSLTPTTGPVPPTAPPGTFEPWPATCSA